MFTTVWKRTTAAGCVGALLASGTLAVAQQREVRIVRALRQDAQAEAPAGANRAPPRAPGRPSEYWLGLECYPADATLRAHLGLSEGQGLVVEQVVPDSPAAKAGLKQHDVLIKVGDKGLQAVPDLIEAVGATKDQELAIEIVRGGKAMTMQVAPAKRPESGRFVPRFEDRDVGQLRGWVESLRQGQHPDPFRYRAFGPGVVLPGGGELPKDLSVSITRQGSEPPKIAVKKGDKSWDVTDQTLSELPEDVRPHVERMLGRGLPVMAPGQPGRFEAQRLEGRSDDRMEKQLKELNQQLEQLRQKVEEMHRALPKANRPPANENKA